MDPLVGVSGSSLGRDTLGMSVFSLWENTLGVLLRA